MNFNNQPRWMDVISTHEVNYVWNTVSDSQADEAAPQFTFFNDSGAARSSSNGEETQINAHEDDSEHDNGEGISNGVSAFHKGKRVVSRRKGKAVKGKGRRDHELCKHELGGEANLVGRTGGGKTSSQPVLRRTQAM